MSTNRGDVPTQEPTSDLPVIPLLDVRGKGPAALVELEPARVAAIIAHGRRSYGGLALRLGDRATWRWLTRNGNPYRVWIASERFWNDPEFPRKRWGEVLRAAFLKTVRRPVDEPTTAQLAR